MSHRPRTMFASLAAAATAAALLLLACGPGPAEKATVEVTLQMVESLTNPTRTTLLKKLIADFESKNSGIKVQLISPPTNQADQKIQQMLQSGKGVDVLEVRDTTVGPFSTNKWIYDMAPDLKDWDGLRRAHPERPQGDRSRAASRTWSRTASTVCRCSTARIWSSRPGSAARRRAGPRWSSRRRRSTIRRRTCTATRSAADSVPAATRSR